MISFKKFLFLIKENIEFDEPIANYDNNSRVYNYFHNILSNKKYNAKYLVDFALHCAKSVFHLNNEQTRSAARECINLVER